MAFKIAVLPALVVILICSSSLAANEVSVFGRYELRTDAQSQEMPNGLVCFYPAMESSVLLRSPDDMPVIWFCFKNEAASKKMLGIPEHVKGKDCGVSGHANVRGSNYAVKAKGDGYYTAVLVAVTAHSAPEILACK